MFVAMYIAGQSIKECLEMEMIGKDNQSHLSSIMLMYADFSQFQVRKVKQEEGKTGGNFMGQNWWGF